MISPEAIQSRQRFLAKWVKNLPATVDIVSDLARQITRDLARHTVIYEFRGSEESIEIEIKRLKSVLERSMPDDIKWTVRRGLPQWVGKGKYYSYCEVYVPERATTFWRVTNPPDVDPPTYAIAAE